MLKRADIPYPVKLLPHEDELLTSYLTRTATAMGLTLRSLCSQSLNNNMKSIAHDIDQINDDVFFSQIAHKTRCKYETIKSLSLVSLVGKVIPCIKKNGMTSGLIAKGRFLAKNQLHGVQYCPECFKESVYIRKHWRCSWISVCDKHQVKLLDACQNCDKPIVFFLMHGINQNKAFCGYCEESLTHGIQMGSADVKVTKFTKNIIEMINTGWMNKIGSHSLYGLSFTLGYSRLLTQLSINPKTHLLIHVIQTKYNAPFEMTSAKPKQMFEQLRIEDRYQSTWCITRLLLDYPENYVDLIRESRLQLYKITPRSFNCYWLDTPFKWSIMKPSYKPSEFEVTQAAKYLINKNEKVSVRQVRLLVDYCFDHEPYLYRIKKMLEI